MVRSHYNQQARLRMFARHEGNHYKLTLVDLKKKRIGNRNVESAFYEEGLYSDELEKQLNYKVESPGMKVFDKIYKSEGKILLTRAELQIMKKYLLIQLYRNPTNISHYDPDWEGDYLHFNEIYRDGDETYQEHVECMMDYILNHDWEELIFSE